MIADVAGGRPAVGRCVAAAAVLLAEFVAVTILFDAQPLRAQPGFAAAPGYLGHAAQILVILAASVLLLGSTRRPGLRQQLRSRPWSDTWPFWLAHLAAFAAFMGVSAVLFAATPPSGATLLGWAGVWLAGVWLCFRLIGAVAIAPITEELAFRGYLLRRLVAADFTAVSYRHLKLLPLLVSSLVFGALHQNFLGGVLAGVLFALAQARRGRLADAMLAHAVSNALIAVYVLLSGNWGLWL